MATTPVLAGRGWGNTFTEITAAVGVAAGPNGALYAEPSSDKDAGEQAATAEETPGAVTVSYDDGATWTPLLAAFPTGFASDCARPSAFGSLFTDSVGDIYVGGTDAAGQLAVIYSRNKGATWSQPVQLQMPGTVASGRCIFGADWNRPGHFGAAYTNGTYGYITMTDNLFDSSPVFTGVQVGTAADPLDSGTAPGTDCSITFSPIDGSPWAAFGDTNSADAGSPETNLENGEAPSWANTYGSLGTTAVATMYTPVNTAGRPTLTHNSTSVRESRPRHEVPGSRSSHRDDGTMGQLNSCRE